MSEMCELVNVTKKERISFFRINASTRKELAGNPAGAAIVTWYLSSNRGDHISIISDYDDRDNPPLGMGLGFGDVGGWPDRTDEVVSELLALGILEDHGFAYQDEDDPEIYLRDLRFPVIH